MSIPTVSGGIFNFVTTGYSPPSFSGAIYDLVTKLVYQVWIDDSYAYVVNSESFDIYDLESELLYAYITYTSGFTTIWANNEKIFLGTSNSGVKYINKTCISGSTSTPYDLYTCLSDLSNLTPYSDLTSDKIKYIHGYGDKLGIITESGIDIIKLNPQSFRSYTSLSGAQKCFMTSTGKFYYTVSGSNESKLSCIYTCLNDWLGADKEYVTGSGVLASGIGLNDIFITEGTATNGYNHIFIATTSGVYKIDEFTSNYDLYINLN